MTMHTTSVTPSTQTPDGVSGEAVVDLGAITHNVRVLREHAGPAQIMAVVKADGYGHGASAVARAAVAAGAAELGVATVGEALSLRRDGITAPVLAWLHPPGTAFGPALAADVPWAVFAPTWVQVSMIMEVLARYGGSMRQPFDLPESFMPGKGAVSLLSLICKLNHRRKNAAGDPLRPEDLVADGLFAADLPNHNVAFLAGLVNRADATWVNSSWLLCDWQTTFAAMPQQYPVANAILDELLQIDGEGSVWAAMNEYADAPWTQLYCSLVESIDYHGSAVQLTAHDGTLFERRFLLAVSLYPTPHPVFQSLPTPIVTDERGYAAVQADATGYAHRPTTLIHVEALESSNVRRSIDTLHNYWSVLPMDASFRGIAQYDAAWMGRLSSWRFPIIDQENVRVYGYFPLELETKFWLTPAGGEFWPLLARKTALQYAWTANSCNEVSGTFSFPLSSANVPRPGDVLLVVGDRTDSSTVVQGPMAQVRKPQVKPTNISALLDGRPGPSGGALSAYVESVSVSMTTDPETGLCSGTVSVTVSHGQVAVVPGAAEHIEHAGGYARVVQLSELHLAAQWWLPYVWPIDIFLRLVGLNAAIPDPTLAVRTATLAQSWAPVVRETATHRATPRRAVAPVAGAVPAAKPLEEAPYEFVGPLPVDEPRKDVPRKQKHAPKAEPPDWKDNLPPAGWNRTLD